MQHHACRRTLSSAAPRKASIDRFVNGASNEGDDDDHFHPEIKVRMSRLSIDRAGAPFTFILARLTEVARRHTYIPEEGESFSGPHHCCIPCCCCARAHAATVTAVHNQLQAVAGYCECDGDRVRVSISRNQKELWFLCFGKTAKHAYRPEVVYVTKFFFSGASSSCGAHFCTLTL